MISMYQVSVPVYVNMLGNLSAILDKAAAHAASRKIDPSVLVNARLFPDMLPLAKQIQIATDQAKGSAARLAGVEVPKYEDNEVTIDELKARIDKTIAFIKGFSPAQIDATEGKDISLTIGGRAMNFKGMGYLLGFAMPNFYFHITTAYDILRHNGVDLGKRDFLGPI